MTWSERIAALLLLAALLAACTSVRYQPEGKAPAEPETPFDRTVNYRIERAFYDDPPRCAVVLPPAAAGGGKATQLRVVETTVARHLAHRLETVIGPDRRDTMARELAVDLGTPAGRKRFAAVARCDAAAVIETTGLETTYVVVWAHARLRLSVRLVRLADGVELWRGAHETSRSEGSLPLSLPSIPVGAFSAGRFQSDADVFPSMADDAVRRIMGSLPDMRNLGGRFRAAR